MVQPFDVSRNYACPSPTDSSASDADSGSWSSAGNAGSNSAAIVPDLADIDSVNEMWLEYETGTDKLLEESAMIDQVLAKLAAEDAAMAGADNSAQLLVLGQAIQAPAGFSGFALL